MAAKQPFRQNLTGAQGTTLTGAHGGVQQLGAAAQRRLQTGQPGTQPPSGPPPGARTPPPFDPATLKPSANNPNADGNMVDYLHPSGPQTPWNTGGRDPATGGMLSFPGGPGQISFPGVGGGGRLPLPPGDMMTLDGSPGQFPGGAPGIASMDGTQNGQAGPPGMFDHTGQQTGVQDPANAGNIDNAIQGLRQQLGASGPTAMPKQPGGLGSGGPIGYTGPNGSGVIPAPTGPGLKTPPGGWISVTGGGAGSGGGEPPPGETPYQQVQRENPGLAGQSGPQFRLPGNGRGFQTGNRINPYAALLRQRLQGGAAGGGPALSGPGGSVARDGSAAGLRGY